MNWIQITGSLVACLYIFGLNWVVNDGVGFCLRGYCRKPCKLSWGSLQSNCIQFRPRPRPTAKQDLKLLQMSKNSFIMVITYKHPFTETTNKKIRYIEWSLIVPRWFERQPPSLNKEMVRCFATDWFGLYNRRYRAIRADWPTHSASLFADFSDPSLWRHIAIGLN